jgi:hypothetical protein
VEAMHTGKGKVRGLPKRAIKSLELHNLFKNTKINPTSLIANDMETFSM